MSDTTHDLSGLPLRIASKIRIDPATGCWRWTRAHTPGGYGNAGWGGHGKAMPAHRLTYMLLVGPIPDGHVIDHVYERGCRYNDCCNPAHLEAVTQLENLMRGNTLNALNAAKTHCPKGHPLEPGNLVGRKGKRAHHRACLTCHRERTRELRALRKREAMDAGSDGTARAGPGS